MNQKEIQKIAMKIATQVIKVLYKDLVLKKIPKDKKHRHEGVIADEKS